MSSKIYLVGEYAVASPEEAVRLALQGDKFIKEVVVTSVSGNIVTTTYLRDRSGLGCYTSEKEVFYVYEAEFVNGLLTAKEI